MSSNIGIQLKGEVSLVDLVAVSTALGVVIAAIYNLGFFSTVEGGFATALNVQDLLMGAALVAAPGSLAYFIGYTGPKLWPRKEQDGVPADGFLDLFTNVWLKRPSHPTPRYVRMILFWIAAGLTVSSLVWMENARTWMPSLLPVSFFITGVLWLVVAAMNGVSRYLFVSVLVTFVLATSYAAGRGTFFSKIDGNYREPSTVEMDNGQSFTGSLVRITSGHIFLYNGGHIATLPLGRVFSIRSDAGEEGPLARQVRDIANDTIIVPDAPVESVVKNSEYFDG